MVCQQRYLCSDYSILRITGSTNWLFTGIPRLIAGLTFGRSVSRVRSRLSIFLVSYVMESFGNSGSNFNVESGKTVTRTSIVSKFGYKTDNVSALNFCCSVSAKNSKKHLRLSSLSSICSHVDTDGYSSTSFQLMEFSSRCSNSSSATRLLYSHEQKSAETNKSIGNNFLMPRRGFPILA